MPLALVFLAAKRIFAAVDKDIIKLLDVASPAKAEGVNGLGFNRSPADTRVVVAMSGGVDSSVTAALLAAQGYDVIGITLQLYDHGLAVQKKGACCAGQDIHDARRVAEAIGIPHYVLDYESRFSEAVMEDFADSYLQGETPIPCVKCNESVKFKDLLKTARDLGADCLATGHYVRSQRCDGKWRMLRAADASKDQSYFLFSTTQEQLDFLRFPLGGLEKDQVRALAAHFNLAVADKPDSQDICFVPQGNYASVIERLRPGACNPGDIVHIDGRILGRHKGIIHYTIGQRRGIGVGGTQDPLYVLKLEPAKNRVVVGPKAELETHIIHVRNVNWLGPDGGIRDYPVNVQIRNTHTPVAALLSLDEAGQGLIRLKAGEMGVSAGQAAVFYDGPHVLGGGWISGAEKAVGHAA